MKKIIVTAMAAILLSSCGTKTVIVEKPVEATQPPVATTPPYDSDEELYLSTVRSEYPMVIESMGEQWVIEFGKIACTAIDDGLTLAGIATLAIQNNVDPEMLGYLIGAAIPAFCPENMWFIKNIGA